MTALGMSNDAVVYMVRNDAIYNFAGLAGTDALDVDSCEFDEGGPGIQQRKAMRPYQDRPLPVKPASLCWQIDLEMEMKASSAAGTAPEWGSVLFSNGMSETVVPATSVTYKHIGDPNAAANVKAVAIQKEMTDEGLTWRADMVRFGNIEIEISNTVKCMLKAKGLGRYVEPINQGTPVASMAFNAGVPLTAAASETSGGFSLFSQTSNIDFKSVKIMFNNTPKLRDSLFADQGNGYRFPPAIERKLDAPLSFEVLVNCFDTSVLNVFNKYTTVASGEFNFKLIAGSRALAVNMPVTVLGKPKKVRGMPDMWTLPGTAHYDTATSKTMDMVLT